ncbi:Helix-turn-helix domain-containing protein [Streptoalloteichus tenebrarius]|uniref:Helix-turn-helix domain-containing protein n=1 Tax=Streptoalloteichus tenebrarius (strain ATCC 17920 / DSM 40477 / JCM 4838 / CBS 697.72 / NBRC 16177 / NCIMB 11028 / NRRL B-12390 / A12253. 1 / ISP 5477) TaxID=1933 RepID=A0ABT1HZT6_STRSD|nr:helix-turn-helix transcriptional regulator [Streptoalloteichus tenebrarius]MCP2261047.1 Helix-turn-helix domain-containing protein [Streptoalloteichus tenebrarius]BFF03159.1 helix-turn-helix transcriptional regulator [Streptoalloteichus tenebrarius]
MTTESPTVRRRRLAMELRRLREAANRTNEEVARHLGCSPSKISRIELGRRPASPGDVRLLLDFYGVNGSEADALVAMARAARQKGWWHVYEDALPESFQVFVGLESDASAMRTFEPLLVPGLMQTEDYARAVLNTAIGADPSDVQRRVEVRMNRQKIFRQRQPVHLWALIDEAVLHRPVGGPAVMREQLERLLEEASNPNITLQVLRFEGGAHPGMSGSFVILEFPSPTDPAIVYLDSLTGGLYTEKSAEVQRFCLVWEHLRAKACAPDESAALIAARAKEYG